MSYSLMHLNPEDAAAILTSLKDPAGMSRFLESLSTFLDNVGSSVASQDLAFCTAAELSATGVWAHIPIHALAPILSINKTPASAAFQRGLPSEIQALAANFDQVQASVLKAQSSPRDSGPPGVPPSNQSRKKTPTTIIRVKAKAGSASPLRFLHPSFAQLGVSLTKISDAFNAATQHLEKGTLVEVDIFLYQDRSFNLLIRQHHRAATWLKNAAGFESGSTTPGKGANAGFITKAQVRAIAEAKMKEMHEQTLEGAIVAVMQEASALGIKVVN